MSTYRLKEAKSTADPLILQNIIQRYGISMLATSHKNGIGEIQKNVQRESYTISETCERADLQTSFS